MSVEVATRGSLPQKNQHSLPRVSGEDSELWRAPQRWLHAPARAWLEHTLQAASSAPRRWLAEPPPHRQALDDLLAQLYPRGGRRGPIPFPPDATALYLAWRARRLMAQGFACEDAFATLAARFGPAAQLPGRSDRALAKLDDLIRRVRSEEGWTIPDWLGPASTQQAHTHRRAMRRTAQRKMLTRLAKLDAKLTGDECSACHGSATVDAEVCPACDGSGSALMAAALRDRLIRELAVSAAPTAMRPRGRPRKGTAPRLTDPARTNDETAEAVVRYLLTHCAD